MLDATAQKRVLVVDDEPGHRLMVRAVLSDAGWVVDEAASAELALERLRRAKSGSEPDVVLLDMRLPGMDGMEALECITRLDTSGEPVPVVLLTAYGSVGSAVSAMKRGAFDYLTKPADNDELTAVMDKARDYSRLLRENKALRQRMGSGGARLIGESPAMRTLKELIAQVGPSEATVLILGDSGTGKELAAEALHEASPRAAKPLVRVNCAALPGELLESELFGHVKGAFTGALRDKPGRFLLADGGTLFLDEIGEMPPGLQAKLLRVLQDGIVEPVGGVSPIQVDTRIITATNRDLAAEAKSGRFREDLYYRLNVLEMRMPPLRERLDDLPLLVGHLLRKLGEKNRKVVRGVSPAFLERLSMYDWPGNVRELENVLERALILSRSDTLGPEMLPPHFPGGPGAADPGRALTPPVVLDNGPMDFEGAEKAAIERALGATGGHRERTADLLGISRRTLQYKLRKYGLARR
ncbi:sigma-54-dependent Fis family transcriptional regulator [Desulfovibrio sulfodismutans]|uniref:Sigma-54-dependent Fis family transcriptional regulator n=1 Tax=Desulfolutivibrio sulfodismutans TaxID=63561 RepID=A0A7K3NKW6_9BACT|nr:sigma-54 dependent transcriptional regulator [Desulfolutivibrio sulfodismutans]NDY56848.1 sigma-54-dependent Fis family transcriptional regulator [Desulfolutivibrio sulfodismutans]QLA13887.1 response regulator [Desulfolutivibrio sulfodismutans DSM 3696]